MGSISDTPSYSVQSETKRIFIDEILNNPLHQSLTNYPELSSLANLVTFTGTPLPSIPINWRFAESISAIKAFEATLLNLLISKKYAVQPGKVTIDTDHASLFLMSPMIAQIVDDESGEVRPLTIGSAEYSSIFKSEDKHRASDGLHRQLATNIYQTKDGRFYHCHGSMNPEPTLTALGLEMDGKEGDAYDVVVERVQGKVKEMESKDIDQLMNEKFKQAGTIAWSSEEFFASDHGKANEKVGLYEIERTGGAQKAGWWPENEGLPSSPKRPLAGLKVVDLTRVIAAPSITRSLAQLGASVMRVTGPNVTDMSVLHQDLSWGKWNCHLDLKSEEGRSKLRKLIQEADVVVEGYRPGAMDRNGFGRKDIFELVKDRERGIIHVKENCYGWHGPWSHRSGWQQISDACCGVSLAFGQAMGNNEAVTPVFPNSDFCTGAAGSCAVLDAILQRAEKGGSYAVDVALNYYSQWLVRSVGTYPAPVWEDVWRRHGSPVFRHYHNMNYTIPAMFKLLQQYDAKTLFNPAFFGKAESKAVGKTFVQAKPIAQWDDGMVELKYNVGTRGNGIDKPMWPKDLSVETVA